MLIYGRSNQCHWKFTGNRNSPFLKSSKMGITNKLDTFYFSQISFYLISQHHSTPPPISLYVCPLSVLFACAVCQIYCFLHTYTPPEFRVFSVYRQYSHTTNRYLPT